MGTERARRDARGLGLDNVEQRRVVLILVTKALELLKSLPVRSRAANRNPLFLPAITSAVVEMMQIVAKTFWASSTRGSPACLLTPSDSRTFSRFQAYKK